MLITRQVMDARTTISKGLRQANGMRREQHLGAVPGRRDQPRQRRQQVDMQAGLWLIEDQQCRRAWRQQRGCKT